MPKYSLQCIPTAHNAFASFDAGFRIWANQLLSIDQQLLLGVRSFMLDLHIVDDRVVLRHGKELSLIHLSIPFFHKPAGHDILFTDILNKISNFLNTTSYTDKNCEIITLILENYVATESIFQILQSVSLDRFLLKENPSEVNVEDMCSKNTRLVIFTGNKKDNKGSILPGIHPPKSYKETNEVEQIGCNQRDKEDGRAEFSNEYISIFLLNHFSMSSPLLLLDALVDSIPLLGRNLPKLADIDFFQQSLSNIERHVKDCQEIFNRDFPTINFNPTLLAVDYIESSGALQYCQTTNIESQGLLLIGIFTEEKKKNLLNKKEDIDHESHTEEVNTLEYINKTPHHDEL